MDKKFERLFDHEDYDVILEGVRFRVNQKVFSPDPELTNSTSLLLKHLPDVNDRAVADIGCGAGVIAAICARKGAQKVIAADINDEAISNTRQNIEYLSLESVVEVRRSNLFENIPEKFDYIFANLPILDEVWGNKKGESGVLIQKFVTQALGHLNPSGSIYLPWGSFSDITLIKQWLQEHRLMTHTIQEEALNYNWTLFRIENQLSVS